MSIGRDERLSGMLAVDIRRLVELAHGSHQTVSSVAL